MSERIVVVGAGHCAGQLVARLRAEGFEGPITLVGEEQHVPYQRPPLSKDYLAGKVGLDRVHLRPQAFYDKSAVALRLGVRAAGIDRARRSVALEDGSELGYERLVLATGASPRRLPVEGEGLPGVHYLRRIEDAEAIQAHFRPDSRMVVVGGGYIGLEVAAVARTQGMAVTVLEQEPRLVSRVVGPEVAEFYRREHTRAGVGVRLGARVAAFEGEGRVQRVVCADGTRVDADCVVVGIGIAPNTALAAAAGLETGDGIEVDELGRTSDPSIYAAGDCTRHPNPVYGRRVRLESVHNAMTQARTVAANLAGKHTPYGELPWFWSDQYDLKLQIAGLSEGYDQSVVRGDPETRSFTVFYLKDGTLIAADSVNAMQDHLVCRKLAAAAPRLPPEQLADTAVALKDLL